ncbi:hypothetical protein JW930_07725 [Candidatus Woesearchaeota archaeon]|nr:hypothetical protein [Candidatus Woesearchaeota archaeon]
MKYAHNIEMRVFCKEDDDEEQIIKIIHSLFPFDFEKERIEFQSEKVVTFEKKKIKIFKVFIKKERHTSKFLKNFFSQFTPDQKDLLKKQLSSRLDERLHFYIRLDKPKLLQGGYWITDAGDCFHFNICIAAYPHKREVAQKIVSKMLHLY